MSLLLAGTQAELREAFLAVSSPRDLARLLEVPYSTLVYHIYKVPPTNRYTVFEIPKRGGGSRTIAAPATALKIIQRKLNQVLQAAYNPRASVQGFLPERGILTNADIHRRQRHVLNLDLKEFFPSINFGRVRGMFMASPYELPADVATFLAQTCCFNNQLPQGAPTSPIVSNMVCARMDSQLLRLAQGCRCRYSRYADDLTFSTSMPSFPRALAVPKPGGRPLIGLELRRLIYRNGFRINFQKTRLRTRSRRQEVTGLTVNQFPNVNRRFLRRVRAILHAWAKYGETKAFEHHEGYANASYRNPSKGIASLSRIVRGQIDFIGMVRGRTDPLYMALGHKLRALSPDSAPPLSDALAHLRREYDETRAVEDHQRRGYMLQDLLVRLFEAGGITVARPFIRNAGAEQIDGAFTLDGWHYIVECRWRGRLASARELDGLLGQVQRAGAQTLGFFISVGGWSDHVIPILKQNQSKSIVLVSDEDIYGLVNSRAPLIDLLRAKLSSLNLEAEPYLSLDEYLSSQSG
jgi:RNA-directed DNA polymerase